MSVMQSQFAANGIDVLLVTGMSGAGRGTAAKLLEDLGWYVADNIPASVIAATITAVRAQEPDEKRIAIVMRSNVVGFAGAVTAARNDLSVGGARCRLLFLDADDHALVRRFEQVRRRHPLQDNGTLTDGIAIERAALSGVAEAADLVVDTSALSVTALREIVDSAFAQPHSTEVRITIESFGFKYGLPIDADLVADMRFLPNPYWIPELRDHTGLDVAVSDYVLNQPGAADYLVDYERIVRRTASGYVREGKRYMTVAIGCTGGKHRSVAMSQALGARLSAQSAETAFDTRVVHRDLGRE